MSAMLYELLLNGEINESMNSISLEGTIRNSRLKITKYTQTYICAHTQCIREKVYSFKKVPNKPKCTPLSL